MAIERPDQSVLVPVARYLVSARDQPCEGQSESIKSSQSTTRSHHVTLLFDLPSLTPLSGRRQYIHTVCLPSLSLSSAFPQPSIIINHRSSTGVVVYCTCRPTPGEGSTAACRPVVSCTVRPYGFLTLWVRSICPRSQVGCRLQQRWSRRGQSQSPSLRLPCPLSSQLSTSRVSTSLRRRSFTVLSLGDSSPGSGTSQQYDQHRVQRTSSSVPGWPISACPQPTSHAIVGQIVVVVLER